MVKIGKWNVLTVKKLVDFGVYLDGGDDVEILLPARYISEPLNPGDEINVFVYTDSEDRLIATTEHPFAEVGEFAFLQVVQVNKVGAFLDWGLAKDLLVPFREQKSMMRQGGIYPVYVYLDDASKRVVASGKIEKFMGNTLPRYRRGDAVKALVLRREEPGYKVVVDNLFSGMLYHNELFREIVIGETVDAYVKTVRPDGKIDLTLADRCEQRVSELAEEVYDYIVRQGGRIGVTDKSSPEEIKAVFSCSKKDFKKALGLLYKNHRIVIGDDGIELVTGK